MRLALVGDLAGADERAAAIREGYNIAGLATALAKRGHDIRLYTAATLPPGIPGVTVVALGVDDPAPRADGRRETLMPMISEMGNALVDRWDAAPPDVVHCFDWTYGMAAQLATNRSSVATVQGFHGLSAKIAQHGGRAKAVETATKLETLLVRNATMVTAACKEDLDQILRMGCARPRVSVLPSGIAVDPYTPVGDTRPASTGHRRMVAVARDLSRYQGLSDVVRALPSAPGTELVLIALDGMADDDVRRLSALAAELGVRERIALVTTAERDEVITWLKAADVVVCPAHYDPYGSVVLHAMACGAPVVATETGGPQDIVIADVTGLLVPPANSDALARALRSAFGQAVLREGMGLAGRSRARSRYSWDRIAIDAEFVYQSAVRRAPAATR